MGLFENIGLKLFFNRDTDNIEDENNETTTFDSGNHIEYIDYKKCSLLKIWFLKKFCMHDWYRYQRININVDANGVPTYIRDTLICKKCGKISHITL